MTSVTGSSGRPDDRAPVGGFALARGYTRSGLVFTALMFPGIPALTVLGDRWGRPVLHPVTLGVVLGAVAVAAAHLALVRPHGRAAPVPGQLVALPVLAVAVVAVLAVTRTAPPLTLLWLFVPGSALTVLVAARGWRPADLVVARWPSWPPPVGWSRPGCCHRPSGPAR